MLEIKKKYKILIVDDSRFNRLVLTSMLAKDYFLEEACDGKEGVQILQDHAEEFSLVLLDIVMPNMNGFEFLNVMKECGWLDFLPVIMISSEYTPENIERSYNLGASDLIRRPYDERVICHRIANTIALFNKQRALSNALVDEVIKENKSSAAMVSILSHIVETRNGESGVHVQNIRYITGMLLEELMKRTDRYPLSKGETLQIVTAASLHDIGKMSVPEEILNKPGKLTDEEFLIMKGHTLSGAHMVESLLKKDANPLIRLTYEICRWHHERYDGRGYPDGLVGDEIPIAAQVVSIADVYDALTSERCYKPAYSSGQAMNMIREGQCGVFNPLLLDCLSGILDSLKELSAFSAERTSNGADSEQLLVANVLAHSRENGVFSSDKIMQTLKHERLRAKFFFNESRAAFYYTVFPPALHLNRAARELYHVEEAAINGEKDLASFEGYDSHNVEILRGKLAEATNEHPQVMTEILVSMRGEPSRRYRCVMQTIWDSPDDSHYAEVMGRLTLLEGGPAGSSDHVREEFFAAGNMLTGRRAYYMISALKFVLYNVRLVDPADSRVVEIDKNGRISKSGQHCYEIWKQERQCENCTSANCMSFQKDFSKIVFFENEVFHVISRYVPVDGTPLVLELLTRITDDTLLDEGGSRLSGRSGSCIRDKLYHRGTARMPDGGSDG